MDRARAAYENADELFLPFTDEDDLERLSRGRDVLVATHFKSVPLVARVREQRRDFLPAYYVQDYEPFFGLNVNGGTPDSVEAAASYQLVPDMLLFAKTHWLCNVVGRMHGIPVAKVEPSIDETLFTGAERRTSTGAPVRVTAMVRPRTWRRQPFTTSMLLDRLKSDLGTGVEVVSFGCADADLDRMLGGRDRAVDHLGLLTRAQVAALLAGADVFVDLSVFQAMGRTGFEAMACGCAAVLPVIGGAHEFAIAGENALLVDPFDPEGAYAALRELILDRDRLGRMQEAGRRTARRRSVLAAVYSEYALFEHEHARRFGGRYAGSSSSVH